MTRFIEEVNEQPQALVNLVSFYEADGAALLKRWRGLLENHTRLVFCGMGTSEYVPLLIQAELLARGKAVSIHDAGEYLHYSGTRISTDTLYISVSQSGESAETKKVAQSLAGKAPLVVLANNEGSAMAGLADLFLPMKAGEEASVSNKTYLNSLGLVYLMAGGSTGKLREIAGYLAGSVNEKKVIEAAEFLIPAASIHFIARGPALACAKQLALTFMEGAKSHGSAFTGGGFRHGPFEVLGPGHRAVCLAPEGRTSGLCLSMAEEIAGCGSRVVLITDLEKVPEHKNLFVIRVRSFGDEKLFPLTVSVVQNYLLYHVARLRGYEAGVFSIVSKVTTVQ